MICIHSNEKLVFQNLLEEFQLSNEMPQFFYSESDNSVWLEMETWLEKVTNKQMEESLVYYYVIDSEMDLVDMYAHLKLIWQFAKGFVIEHLTFHVVITFANDQISKTDALNNKAKELFEKLTQLNSKRKPAFSFDVFFHFAYNLFGESKFVSINESSVIQQFININNESNEGAYLTINPDMLLTGTDVKLFCSKLIKERSRASKPSVPDIYKDTVLMPKPILLQELISKIHRGTFNFEGGSKMGNATVLVEKQLRPFINWESNISLTDQILTYIN
jgi:hypothetical protein